MNQDDETRLIYVLIVVLSAAVIAFVVGIVVSIFPLVSWQW